MDWIIWAISKRTKISKIGESGDRKKVGEEVLIVTAMVASSSSSVERVLIVEL